MPRDRTSVSRQRNPVRDPERAASVLHGEIVVFLGKADPRAPAPQSCGAGARSVRGKCRNEPRGNAARRASHHDRTSDFSANACFESIISPLVILKNSCKI